MEHEQVIWKFVLEPKDVLNPKELIEVEMPAFAQILCAQSQGDEICVWAIFDKGCVNTKEKRRFEVFGTGWTIKDERKVSRRYIGTVQLEGGLLVLHVFLRLP